MAAGDTVDEQSYPQEANRILAEIAELEQGEHRLRVGTTAALQSLWHAYWSCRLRHRLAEHVAGDHSEIDKMAARMSRHASTHATCAKARASDVAAGLEDDKDTDDRVRDLGAKLRVAEN